MTLSPKRATAVLKDLRHAGAYAVYTDGTRLRLGQVRIYSFKRERDTWVEWGGVKVIRPGTITAIDLGRTSVSVPPLDVRVDMTFSASVPLSKVLGARVATR